jgi:hypothetical protein
MLEGEPRVDDLYPPLGTPDEMRRANPRAVPFGRGCK